MPTTRECRLSLPATTGDLARAFGVPLHVITNLVRRRGIAHVGRRGRYRVYDRSGVQAMLEAFRDSRDHPLASYTGDRAAAAEVEMETGGKHVALPFHARRLGGDDLERLETIAVEKVMDRARELAHFLLGLAVDESTRRDKERQTGEPIEDPLPRLYTARWTNRDVRQGLATSFVLLRMSGWSGVARELLTELHALLIALAGSRLDATAALDK